MAKHTVFITRPIPPAGVNALKKKVQVKLRAQDSAIGKKALLDGVKKADALLSILTDTIDARLMDAAPNLKVISNYAVGFDNIDIDAATERGIVVTNTPGALSAAVAEHTLALMLAVARRVPEADRFTRKGKFQSWMPSGFLGPTLVGKTLGIVGTGRIGEEIARRAHHGLDMNIIYHDVQKNPRLEKQFDARYASLNQLCKKADVISVHVPLLPSTRHLISTEQFRHMKKTAIVVNTSRGPVIAEKPLVRALKKRAIFGAGIDVFENEPAIDVDPNDALELKALDNAVLTPHIASATEEARSEMSMLAATGILSVLAGKKPTNIVNPTVWNNRR